MTLEKRNGEAYGGLYSQQVISIIRLIINIMNKYKVNITKTYCIDVLAEDVQTAEEKAGNYLFESLQEGTGHYLQTGDNLFTTFDVTNTDDNFDAI